MPITLADLAAIPPTTSTLARQYLFDNLTSVLPADTENGASLVVCFDGPTYRSDDIVSVGDVAIDYEFSGFVGSGGAGWLRERYALTVQIDVFRGGDDAQMTYARASYLSDLVCALVRYDVTLGTEGNVRPQPQIVTATPKASRIESEWDEDNRGRHSFATVEISVLAQR